MKRHIWLSFDLGVRGDYEGMYQFLDNHIAKECGDSIAYFEYEFKKDLVAELKKDLSHAVKLERRSRVYVIFLDESGRQRGRFLVGARKRPPWTGYGVPTLDEEDVGG